MADGDYCTHCMHGKPCACDGPDMVNHPPHYIDKVPGIECIDVVEHMNFNRGNAIKYVWRAGSKGDELEDLKKAAWYIQREIDRVEDSL